MADSRVARQPARPQRHAAAAQRPAERTLDIAPLDTAPLDTAPLDTAPLDTAPLDTVVTR
jgi:hypothetical protein